MLYFFAIKEEYGRQHSDQHHRAINALFVKEELMKNDEYVFDK